MLERMTEYRIENIIGYTAIERGEGKGKKKKRWRTEARAEESITEEQKDTRQRTYRHFSSKFTPLIFLSVLKYKKSFKR